MTNSNPERAAISTKSGELHTMNVPSAVFPSENFFLSKLLIKFFPP
jgi:hypothetical protein